MSNARGRLSSRRPSGTIEASLTVCFLQLFLSPIYVSLADGASRASRATLI